MLQLVLSSLSQPRETAPTIIRWPVGHRELVMAAVLVAVLSGLVDAATRFVAPLPEEFQSMGIASPITMTIVQLISIFVITMLMYRVGQLFGGVGEFLDAFKITIWLSLVGLVFTLITVLIMIISPGMAQLFQFVSIIWMLVVFTVFIQELHGFTTFFTTLAGIIATMFAVATIIVVGLSMFGLMPQVA